MDGYSVYGARDGPAAACSSSSTAGHADRARDGEVWITQEGDDPRPRHRAAAGFRARSARHRPRNFACKGARITLTAPVPAHYAERITRTLAGSAPRVL
jgi:hypothetical protein